MDWSDSKYEHNEGDEDTVVDSKHDVGEDVQESEEGHEAIEEHLKYQGLPISWDMATGRYRRRPAILRSNKQMYAEAVSILYSELQVCLKLDNLLIPGEELSNNLTVKGTIRPSIRAWRHNPLLGIGREDENSNRVYTSPAMEGYMAPHIFARFSEAELFTEFDITADVPTMFIFDNLKIDPNHEDAMADFLGRSTIMRRLVEILRHSPVVSILSFRYFAVHSNLDFNDHEDISAWAERNLILLISCLQLVLEQQR